MILPPELYPQILRRTFLGKSAQSVGALALASLVCPEALKAAELSRGVINPLPLPQRAKRVI